ncbi:hypothetical protein OCU04_005309 [Sclerotinia nivalis]|uniref:Uncharacterized protein n=1 Tax=Sclerotinia nivalis TaxID=352851 RepID=A0A9X0DL28_9HELO|nr:hypothetical protein OCU04_005309 [Sclerotinia nivalis]
MGILGFFTYRHVWYEVLSDDLLIRERKGGVSMILCPSYRRYLFISAISKMKLIKETSPTFKTSFPTFSDHLFYCIITIHHILTSHTIHSDRYLSPSNSSHPPPSTLYLPSSFHLASTSHLPPSLSPPQNFKKPLQPPKPDFYTQIHLPDQFSRNACEGGRGHQNIEI